jgi:hypothetical protein
MVAMVNRRAIFVFAGLSLTGCGALDHFQMAPGQFDIRGNGIYAYDAGMQREASQVCPAGYSRLGEEYEPGPAELGRTRIWHIACNGPPQPNKH